MSSVADAKAAIYDRLAAAPTFHPSSASLFTDWTVQGGDVVSVKSDNTTYNVPVYGMKMKWNGSTKVSVQNSGDQQMPTLEKMAQDKNNPTSVGGGGRGYRAEKKKIDRLQWIVGIDENGEYYVDHPGAITLAINDALESIAQINANHVNISSTSTLHTLAGAVEYNDQGKFIIKEAGGMYVRRQSGGTTAEFGVFDDGNLTGGICVTKINGQTSSGGTVLKLSADVIDIDGVVSALTSEYIAVVGLSVTGEDADSLETNYITCYNDISCGGDLTADYVGCNDIKVTGNFHDGTENHSVSWKSMNVGTSITPSHAGSRWYASSTDGETVTGRWYFNPMTGATLNTSAIHYLGYT